MPTDLFGRVAFNDGEGLTFGDLNLVGSLAESRLADQLLHGLIGDHRRATELPVGSEINPEFGGDEANAVTRHAYCLNPGHAFLKQGASNAKLRLSAGTLYQKTTSITGTAPTLLAFTFDGSATYDVTIANGDATNPRVDLLQMKLEAVDSDSLVRDFEDATTRLVTSQSVVKRRRVQCTLSLKQGTAAATPQIPSEDAGYVPVAMVVVPATWTGASPLVFEDTAGASSAMVYDLRMPLRVRSYRVQAASFLYGSGWTYSNATGILTAGGSASDVYVPCPSGIGRLVGLGLFHGNTGTATLTLGKFGRPSGAVGFSTRNTATFTSGLDTEEFSSMQTIEANYLPSAGPSAITASASGIAPPVWASHGCRAARGKYQPSTVPKDHQLALRISSATSGTTLTLATYHIAEGI